MFSGMIKKVCRFYPEKNRWGLSCVLVLALLSIPPAFAESSVWKISGNGHILYLGGTIHILTQDDYPLPPAYDHAYNRSAVTVFETDINELNSPQSQMKMLGQVMYTDGSSLLDYLSEDTEQRLIEYCANNGIPLQAIVPLKVGMASVTLTLIELQKLGLVGTGVDQFYSNKSSADGRNLGQLETVDEQIKVMAEMGQGNEDSVIQYTLNDIGRLAEIMREMKSAWRSGDIEALEPYAINDMREQFPAVYEALLVKRNRAWMPKIEAMLKTAEVEFVLVGLAHLAGPEGLLAELTEKGYQIEQVRTN